MLFQDGFKPNGTLHAQRKVQDARFGYAMAVAPDLNHDGYTDLLVGAPLEDDHQGALYIYHGDEYYIIPQYKQVNNPLFIVKQDFHKISLYYVINSHCFLSSDSISLSL